MIWLLILTWSDHVGHTLHNFQTKCSCLLYSMHNSANKEPIVLASHVEPGGYPPTRNNPPFKCLRIYSHLIYLFLRTYMIGNHGSWSFKLPRFAGLIFCMSEKTPWPKNPHTGKEKKSNSQNLSSSKWHHFSKKITLFSIKGWRNCFETSCLCFFHKYQIPLCEQPNPWGTFHHSRWPYAENYRFLVLKNLVLPAFLSIFSLFRFAFSSSTSSTELWKKKGYRTSCQSLYKAKIGITR